MTEETGEPTADAAVDRLILDSEERRVIGTLIEKGLTSPQSYPLSANALLTGCNQKSNRDPITHFSLDQLEEICERLRERDLLSHLLPTEGRVSRWRQELGRNYELRGVELAVIGELLLRGAQSEGELRQRASRMREVPGLGDLHQILHKLRDHSPPFVVRLTPEGVSRGVRWTHCCYKPKEMEQILADERAGVRAPAPAAAAPRSSELDDLRARVEQLEARLARLEHAFGAGGGGSDG